MLLRRARIKSFAFTCSPDSSSLIMILKKVMKASLVIVSRMRLSGSYMLVDHLMKSIVSGTIRITSRGKP